MATYDVEITRTISTTVTVAAASAEEAVALVNRRDFPLPARDAWTGHKDWRFAATSTTDPDDTHEEGS